MSNDIASGMARAELPSQDCELCEAAPITPRIFEDEMCWIAECESCFVPMVVWRTHGAVPPQSVVMTLRARLDAVAQPMFGAAYFVDETMRSIPDHYHAHARRRPWAAVSSGEASVEAPGGAGGFSRGER